MHESGVSASSSFIAGTEFERLPLLTQTAYARLLDLLLTTPKDRAQASALLRLLIEDLPGEVTLAWKALCRRGKAWSNAATISLRLLDPDLIAELRRLGVRG